MSRIKYWVWALVSVVFVGILSFLFIKTYTIDTQNVSHISALVTVTSLGIAIVGFIFSVISAEKASGAYESSESTREELLENSLLLQEIKDYETLFTTHVSKFMKQDNGHGLPSSQKFLISTPIYGYHVLGTNYASRFRTGLRNTLGSSTEIIVYTPDKHYYHVANTLLWDGVQIKDERQTSSRGVQITRAQPEELADEVDQLFATFRSHIDQGDEGPGNISLWSTNTSNIRMSYFNFESEMQRAFLILTDEVSLSSNLLDFNGRFVPLNKALHKEIFEDEDSYYEQFKECPYSGDKGKDSKIERTELHLLKSDFLLMKTSSSIFSFEAFLNNVKRFTHKALKLDESMDDKQQLLSNTLNNILGYFLHIIQDGEIVVSQSSYQEDIIREIDDTFNGTEFTDDIKNKPVVESHLHSLPDYFVSRDEIEDSSNLTISIYSLLSSGFRKSEYAMNRES